MWRAIALTLAVLVGGAFVTHPVFAQDPAMPHDGDLERPYVIGSVWNGKPPK